ncbi:hypothetical protein Leryth_027110 [Lithospermum erythrorhizon]|nr:hypothetical protein Leryth_027110 [Lithospermum erythrorhizon]
MVLNWEIKAKAKLRKSFEERRPKKSAEASQLKIQREARLQRHQAPNKAPNNGDISTVDGPEWEMAEKDWTNG